MILKMKYLLWIFLSIKVNPIVMLAVRDLFSSKAKQTNFKK